MLLNCFFLLRKILVLDVGLGVLRQNCKIIEIKLWNSHLAKLLCNLQWVTNSSHQQSVHFDQIKRWPEFQF